jgi:hypothetical protein
MVRKTVDILAMRDSKNGREFLTLGRSVFPEGAALPGALLSDEDEQNDAGIPSNIFAALRVMGNKVFGSLEPEYGISEVETVPWKLVSSYRFHVPVTTITDDVSSLKSMFLKSD